MVEAVQVLPLDGYDIVAWTLDGRYDGANCLDLDPLVLYRDGIDIADPLDHIA